MKPLFLAFLLFLAAVVPAGVPAGAQASPKTTAPADVTGLWVADFFGNRVECHLEQRGQFLYGVAYVLTRTGERNTYHIAGLVLDNTIRAMHGGGNTFVGAVQDENVVAGTFAFKDGPSFAMQAERTMRGKTAPGGLEWPAGYPPTP
ncbi:MAG: hypothetical protein FD177_152 [Desulfovibrionaceae bacterium]|nr:MAG: hypothetical protein FD177_152 [Desulfovibrionaceae bacterium]